MPNILPFRRTEQTRKTDADPLTMETAAQIRALRIYLQEITGELERLNSELHHIVESHLNLTPQSAGATFLDTDDPQGRGPRE